MRCGETCTPYSKTETSQDDIALVISISTRSIDARPASRVPCYHASSTDVVKVPVAAWRPQVHTLPRRTLGSRSSSWPPSEHHENFKEQIPTHSFKRTSHDNLCSNIIIGHTIVLNVQGPFFIEHDHRVSFTDQRSVD